MIEHFHFHDPRDGGYDRSWCGLQLPEDQNTALPICPRCYVILGTWEAFERAVRFYGPKGEAAEVFPVLTVEEP